jgi:outer membrane protein TolC
MKCGLYGWILLSVAGLTGLSVLADEPHNGEKLELSQAIQEAISHSPDLKFSRASEDEASGKHMESLSGLMPTLGVAGYHYTSQKYQVFDANIGGTAFAIPVVTPATSLKLSLTLPVFDGFKSVNQVRASRSASDAASESTRWQEFQVTQFVSDAFYRSLAAEQLAEVATENIKTLEDHYEHVQSRRKGGIATSYDVLRVEVQLDEARTQKIQADDNVVLERKRLARLMGTPEDMRLISGDLPEPIDAPKIDELTAEKSLESRKDLHSLQLQERASDLADTASKSWLVPSFGVMADYEFYNNTNFDVTNADPYHNDYDVGVYVRWNVFDGGASIGKAQQSSAQLRQAQAHLDSESQRLPENLELWKRRYRYGVSLYKTSVSDIKKSEESVRQAKEGFKQGVRTVSEQLDAQLDLFRSRASKVNAQLSTAEALIQLELTVGRKLANADLN